MEDIQTIYGYRVDYLIILAEVLKINGYTPDQLEEIKDWITLGYNLCKSEIDRWVESYSNEYRDIVL